MNSEIKTASVLEKETKTPSETHVSKTKLKIVEELSDLIKNKKTILIASIKNLPASQFQEIGKKLRDKAVIKVPKKNFIFRALDFSDDEKVQKLKVQIKNSVAILFSDLDCFELSMELLKNKSPTKAKPGQEAPEDIEIQAGPTDLLPGPAISELGSVGIQIQIEKGKIHIKESRVIVKKGEKISQNASDVMNKLDIKPFSSGFIPLSAFDTKERKLYLEININPEETLNELKTSFGKALAFAVEINYICEDTIKFLIGKAGSHEKALDNLVKEEKSEEAKPEEEIKEKQKVKDEEVKENEKPEKENTENNIQQNIQEDK